MAALLGAAVATGGLTAATAAEPPQKISAEMLIAAAQMIRTCATASTFGRAMLPVNRSPKHMIWPMSPPKRHWLLARPVKFTATCCSCLAMAALLGAAVATGGLTAATAAEPPQKISAEMLIAAASDLTGRYKSRGSSIMAGARLAVRDINAAGGLRLGNKTFKLKLLVFNDACNRSAAVKAAKAIVAARAALIVGHGCASASIEAAKVYAGANIIQISPATRHPRFTDRRAGPAIFRLAGREDQEGFVAGQYLARRYRGKRIVVAHDRTLAAMALVKSLAAGLASAGASSTPVLTFRPGQQDYSRFIAKVKGSKAEVLYIASYLTEVALISRQITAKGPPVTIMSSSVIGARQFATAANGAAQGSLLTRRPDPHSQPGAAAVIARLRAEKTPITMAALAAYAAVTIWREAAEAMNSLQKADLVRQLNRAGFVTILGPVSFDKKGDANVPSYAIYRWSRGQLQPVVQPGTSTGHGGTAAQTQAGRRTLR